MTGRRGGAKYVTHWRRYVTPTTSSARQCLLKFTTTKSQCRPSEVGRLFAFDHKGQAGKAGGRRSNEKRRDTHVGSSTDGLVYAVFTLTLSLPHPTKHMHAHRLFWSRAPTAALASKRPACWRAITPTLSWWYEIWTRGRGGDAV